MLRPGELLPNSRRLDQVPVAARQFRSQAGQPSLVLCQCDGPHHQVLREFVVAAHFHAGRPIEGRTSVDAGQRRLISDEVFSITAGMLMANHEGT